jgi:alpha-D-ribose 1-methylphosphonate 5-triphosphate synthase subunit PhnH
MTGMKRIHSFDEVFDAQKVFRLILTAMANPSRIVDIGRFADKLYGDEPEMLAVAMTLLDNEVSFHACGGGGLSEDILSLTLSKPENMENADYIFIADPAMLEDAISGAKCGTLEDPHKSATLIVKTDGNGGGNSVGGGDGERARRQREAYAEDGFGRTCGRDDSRGACILRLSGPGIEEAVEVAAAKLVKTALDIRDRQYYEYPQGIDMIFISEGGSLFAVPRLTRKEAL